LLMVLYGAIFLTNLFGWCWLLTAGNLEENTRHGMRQATLCILKTPPNGHCLALLCPQGLLYLPC